MLSKQNKVFIYIAAGIASALLIAVAVLYIGYAARNASPKQDDAAQEVPQGYELLSYVPSDASAVICSASLSNCLEKQFQPDHVFRNMDFGALSSSQVAVSFHYVGDLIPLLVVDVPKAVARHEELVEQTMKEAAVAGLSFLYYPSVERGDKSVLLLSPSENVLSSAVRHIEENTSLLEAHGVGAALTAKVSKGDVLLIRNGAAANLFEKSFLSTYFKRNDFVSFLRRASEWTVLSLNSANRAGRGEYLAYRLGTVQAADDPSSFMNMLSACPAGASKLEGCLPYGTSFVLDMPVGDLEAFFSARAALLDARGSLLQYGRTLDNLKASSGIGPEGWARQVEIREVARIYCRKDQLILVRTALRQDDEPAHPNLCSGFVPALFGSAFAIPDDSFCAIRGEWMVFGSEAAVQRYLHGTNRMNDLWWPSKNVKLLLLADDIQFCATSKDAELSIYRKF
ncbi:MAG: hypothetical protein KBS55_02640 [Bacteroidales bacterium]|nr:hypothetical protein [Candidatus Cryptobacteroides aphodequi]